MYALILISLLNRCADYRCGIHSKWKTKECCSWQFPILNAAFAGLMNFYVFFYISDVTHTHIQVTLFKTE